MAKQIGIIKLEGTIGDINFYRSGDGYLARQNTSISAERIATDPAFQRTRENGAEFGRAGKGAKLIRTAFRSELQAASDKRTSSRLVKELMRVVKSDAVNARGMRGLVDGEKTLLQGFDFNNNAQLGTTLYAPFTATINRTSGEATVVIPPYTPVNSVVAPVGATHYRILSAAAELDFETETYVYDGAASAVLPWNGTDTSALTLTCNLSANSTAALFLVLGVEFYQMVNGTHYTLNNGAFNPLNMVKVSQV